MDEQKKGMKGLEEDPPKNLEDWPDDEFTYETFGGREGDHSYDEGPERKLGPSAVEHHSEGSVTIDGDPVAGPDSRQGGPAPALPTRAPSPRRPARPPRAPARRRAHARLLAAGGGAGLPHPARPAGAV